MLLAAEEGEVACLKLLLEKGGADIMAKNEVGDEYYWRA